ncbi:MAG: selenium-dependent molybdenum cofactor biosynthesis protein YqeB [Lachnospirales bacterium]
MDFEKDLIIVRGGGDIATGVIQKLFRTHFNVLVLECKYPSAIRHSVALSQCIYDGKHKVEGMSAIRVSNICEIKEAFLRKEIPVLVDEDCAILQEVKPIAVVDAILAKRNLGTRINMAPIVIGVGPGFNAGEDCHCVIETQRGHNLGRLIFEGEAEKNTGVPGEIGGESHRRVLRSPREGTIEIYRKIGDIVSKGDIIAKVGDAEIKAEFEGLLRGVIADSYYVTKNFKVGDVDPRKDQYGNCFTISDKARNIGGGVLEAIFYLKK